ncbi:MAG: Glycosyl transferase family 2 [Parcubacteria group bacterium GW2011_GWA1_36_12]|nr:MAG: Glycosyl transferase family 2 [Parcubacteria group bacterium GW2011_GWA1_36_12]
MTPKISTVVSAYNEEEKIEECLKSVENLADEIIFVDNTSHDKTIEIAKRHKAKVFIRPNDPVMLNKNKNYGFSKAAGDWILSLDADERITPVLAKEIKAAVKQKNIKGFEIPRKNIIFNKWIQHSIWWPDYNLRLFQKNSGRFPEKHVHEKIEVSGKVAKLENPMTHYNYQTISQFLRKLDTIYTESETENFIKKGDQIHWYDAIRWPASDFLKTFFLERGYKDGLHGLVLSLFQAFYSLVFFAKVWEKKEKFKDLTPDNFLREVSKEFAKVIKDSKYWFNTVMIDELPAKKLYYKIRRKIS